MSLTRIVGRASLLLAAAAAVATPALAQDQPQVHIHGFGGMGYGRTDANEFGIGTEQGKYRNAAFTLNLTAIVNDRLAIVAQSEWEDAEEGSESVLDFAFGDLRFSKAANLRFGQVKQPFGISTEVFDVGTLRPFFSLPQSVYGPSGSVGEAYRGVGFAGTRSWEHWGLSYDVYGGALEIPENESGFEFLAGEAVESEIGEHFEETANLLGGRLQVQLPIDGLSAGVSGFSGRNASEEHEDATADAIRHGRRTTVGAHLRYEAARFELRTEGIRHTETQDDHPVRTLGGYAQASFRVTPTWEVAGMYDRLYSSIEEMDVSAAPSLLQHRDLAAGVNYWFTPNVVLKSALHSVRGNRFAGPEDEALAATIQAGQLERQTKLVTVGVQFSF